MDEKLGLARVEEAVVLMEVLANEEVQKDRNRCGMRTLTCPLLGGHGTKTNVGHRDP